MNICIFEDEGVKTLSPMVDFRPVFDLRAGSLLIREKIASAFPDADISYFVRDAMLPSVQAANPEASVNALDGEEDILFINGRLLMDASVKSAIENLDIGQALVCSGDVVAARTNADSFDLKNLDFSHSVKCNAVLVKYIWELIAENGSQIESDFQILTLESPSLNGHISADARLVHRENIHISDSSDIQAGVVINAENGSVYIDENATVMANTFIEGPAFIGKNTIIKAGAKIYGGSSIGEMCKVGGEVENSIIHSYSNKQHDGFLGHSYLGSWVNLGANTNTSDLKNDYGNVKVHCGGEMIDSGSKHIGLIMGDHSKSGISTMFTTGTVVGSVCNLFGSGFHIKSVPSFTWGGADTDYTEYRLNKAIEVAEKVMGRRDVPMTAEDKSLFQSVFDFSSADRKSIL